MDIFEAARTGDCEQILKSITSINTTNDKSETPLIVAIKNTQVEAVNVLIKNGAEVNASDTDGLTPLQWAVRSKQIQLVLLVLDAGAEVNVGGKVTNSPLLRAVILNQFPIVRLLLSRGADVNYRSSSGDFLPLLEAAALGYDAMVLFFLKHGADPNAAVGTSRLTALTWAIQKCSCSTVLVLLEAGANPWHQTQNGSTPLSLAVGESMKRLVSEFCQEGGPSWLVRELRARGLQWEEICGVQDKLAKEGFRTYDDFLSVPVSSFTELYLQRIGIEGLRVRYAVLDMRLRTTWLGAKFADHRAQYEEWFSVWERALLNIFPTEVSFLQVPNGEMCTFLVSKGIPGPVCATLAILHKQLCGAAGSAADAVQGSASEVDGGGVKVKEEGNWEHL